MPKPEETPVVDPAAPGPEAATSVEAVVAAMPREAQLEFELTKTRIILGQTQQALVEARTRVAELQATTQENS